MRFAVKIILSGLATGILGIWMVYDGLRDDPQEEAINGFIWRGSLISLVGTALFVMGCRIYRDLRAQSSASEIASESATQVGTSLFDVFR